MNCWNPLKLGHQSEACEGKRNGLKTAEIPLRGGNGQSAAKFSAKAGKGSETTRSSKRKKRLVKWPEDQQMIDWYEQDGMSTTQIAKKINSSTGGVYAHLVQLGVTIRNKKQSLRLHHEQRHGGDAGLLWDAERLRDLYLNQKLSSFEIADMVGCGRQAVVYACKRFGIPMRQAVRTSHTQVLLANVLNEVGCTVTEDQIDMKIPGTRYCGDIVFLPERLVVEVDGYFHTQRADTQFGTNRQEKDQLRDERIRKAGFRIARFWEWDVKANLHEIAARIAVLLRTSSHECRATSDRLVGDIVRPAGETQQNVG